MQESMDSEVDARSALEICRLEGWRETGKELGRGSYGTVVEVNYKGLKCAGKKIHRVLYEGGEGDLIQRFEEECRLLSQLRHPHIVQFLGVYFEEDTNVPVLVMEFLPITLAQALDRYGLLPEEISYSILRDLSLGLRYLHERTNPIVHRDLSANNVLLSRDCMTAKICDLGVAKILRLTPLQKSMTYGPGTLCYMPPEALVPEPRYDVTIDIFSFGVLIVHVLSGEWPFPQEAVKVDPIAPSQLTPVSEMDRRSQCIKKIPGGHPLMQLISQCLHNSPTERPQIIDVCQQIDDLASQDQHPAVYENRIELLQQMHAVLEERASLRDEVQLLHSRMEFAEAASRSEIQELQTCQTCNEAEIEQLRASLAELRSDNTTLKETQNAKDRAHASQLEGERKDHESQMAIIREQLQTEQQRYNADMSGLKFELKVCQEELQGQQQSHQAQIQAKEAEKAALMVELEESRSNVSRKEETIETLREQLGRLQEALLHGSQVHNPFPPEMKLVWSQCADLPVGMYGAQAVLIDESIYVGGGSGFTANIIFKYNTIKNSWIQLPPAPIQYFGLGQLRGSVVLVGGSISHGDVLANVYTLDDTQHWTESFPPMPTARRSSTVISYKGSALIVCGGVGKKFLDTVELFKIETSQWCGLHSLPFPWSGMSVATMGDTCFLMGGRTDGNVPSKAVIACRMNQLIADPDTPWKALPDCPHTYSAVAVLNGCVLSIGGGSKMQTGAKTDAVVDSSDHIYVYCPTVSRWIDVGKLPAPCSFYTVLVLPTNKLVVIGGIGRGQCCTTMWQGKIDVP